MRLLVLFLPTLSLACGGVRAEAERASPLRVGTTGDHPPFSEAVGEVFIGIDVDLARDFGASLGRPVRFVRTRWSSVVSDLVADRYQLLISGVHVSHEREEAAQFSRSYLRVGKQAIVRCSDVGRFNTVADVNRLGVRVVATLGAQTHRFLRDYVPNASVISHADGPVESVSRLAAGEGDIYFGNRLHVQTMVRRDQRLCHGLGGEEFGEYRVAALFPEESELLPTFDQWLSSRLDDGSVAQTIRAHTGD